MNKSLCFFVCILCLSFLGCKKKEELNGVPYRPDEFPGILVPLEGATEIQYLSPETGKIVEGAYSISFWVDEEYPASNTIERIKDYLKSHNCIRVEWMPDDFAIYTDKDSNNSYIMNAEETQKLRDDLKKNQSPRETEWKRPNSQANYADIIHSTWHEEWITENDALFTIVLDYYFPNKGYEGHRIGCHLTLFTPSSWKCSYVKKYKEMHPEQFQDLNAIEIKSPGN